MSMAMSVRVCVCLCLGLRMSVRLRGVPLLLVVHGESTVVWSKSLVEVLLLCITLHGGRRCSRGSSSPRVQRMILRRHCAGLERLGLYCAMAKVSKEDDDEKKIKAPGRELVNMETWVWRNAIRRMDRHSFMGGSRERSFVPESMVFKICAVFTNMGDLADLDVFSGNAQHGATQTVNTLAGCGRPGPCLSSKRGRKARMEKRIDATDK